jgi:hypothetical protein
MSATTDDPSDPKLGHGINSSPVPQNEKYLVLSEEERSKGFVRPLRTAYIHVGTNPEVKGTILIKLSSDGCGTRTEMSRAIAETYARNPKFYGATYCCGCRMHRPLAEFIWEGTTEIVGS